MMYTYIQHYYKQLEESNKYIYVGPCPNRNYFNIHNHD